MDADLLETLYRKHYSAAYAYCISLCGDVHLAQDVTADAFLKAYLSLPDDVPSFRYWLLRVCKNLWIDYLRRHRREVPDEPLQFLTDGATPEALYMQNERNQRLANPIASLAPIDQELVTLHYFSGVPLQEAAMLLGKSYPAIRQRMVRLRLILKQKMEEQGYGL